MISDSEGRPPRLRETGVDVVVCAHNEEATVERICRAVVGAPSLGHLYVVADACTDRTAELAGSVGATVLPAEFKDKGSAMAWGLYHVTTRTVAFIDADLEGLTARHVEMLLTHPPIYGMVVGVREKGRSYGRWPQISGERRLPTDVAADVALIGASWRAEQRINAAVVAAGLPWSHFVMPGVYNPPRRKPEEWAKVAGATLENAGPIARMLLNTRKARP